MGYFNCRQGGRHADCDGYIGPLDTFVCSCSCHEPPPAPSPSSEGSSDE